LELTMRIGIDYLPALCHPPGVGRYVRELVRALVQLDERPDLLLFEVGRGVRAVDPRALGLSIGDKRVQRLAGESSRRWMRLAHRLGGRGVDQKLGGVDVFHHVSPGSLPVSKRAKQSIALCDVPPSPGTEADARLRGVLERIDLVFAFSDAQRSTLMQRYSLAPERVARVHVGCEHWRRSLTSRGKRASPPRIVVLGAVRASRRPLTVLRAFERLCESGVDARLEFLDRAGAPPDPAAIALEDALRTSKAAAKVAWTRPSEARGRGPVEDPFELEAALPARVATASLLVHLSADEPSPVTPLEALAVGVPVVASRIGAFEEALSGAATLVDDGECQREPDVLAEAMRQALSSAEDGQASARREVVARAYTWERCARETLDAWRRVAAAAA
jgi:glycosyltransferase involved in cell wall biosynthesis